MARGRSDQNAGPRALSLSGGPTTGWPRGHGLEAEYLGRERCDRSPSRAGMGTGGMVRSVGQPGRSGSWSPERAGRMGREARHPGLLAREAVVLSTFTPESPLPCPGPPGCNAAGRPRPSRSRHPSCPPRRTRSGGTAASTSSTSTVPAVARTVPTVVRRRGPSPSDQVHAPGRQPRAPVGPDGDPRRGAGHGGLVDGRRSAVARPGRRAGRQRRSARIGGRRSTRLRPPQRCLCRRPTGDRHGAGRHHRATRSSWCTWCRGTGGEAIFPRTVIRCGAGFRGQRRRDRRRCGRRTVGRTPSGPDAGRPESAGPQPDHLVVPVTELRLADEAALAYVSVQSLGPGTWQLGHQASVIGRDAIAGELRRGPWWQLCPAADRLGAAGRVRDQQAPGRIHRSGRPDARLPHAAGPPRPRGPPATCCSWGRWPTSPTPSTAG